MREIILQALKKAVEEYPEIKDYLKGEAADIVRDGIEWHMKFEPYTGRMPVYDEEDNAWEVTQEDIDAAVARWDEIMPKYKGMLDAKIEDDNA